MKAFFLKHDLNVVEYLKQNKSLIVQNKGRSGNTNHKLFNLILVLVQQKILKETHRETKNNGQTSIVVELNDGKDEEMK